MLQRFVGGCPVFLQTCHLITLPTFSFSYMQAAFRGMAQRWHPDHVAESEKKLAADRFREAVEAYTILRDDRKRADYDRGIF